MSISSKDWTLDGILNQGKHFKRAPRISAQSPPVELARAIQEFETSGIPLVIEKCHHHLGWPGEVFNLDWYYKNHGGDIFIARNVHTYEDHRMRFKDFLEKCRTDSSASQTDGSPVESPLYGKDAECPSEWKRWLENSRVLPEELLPASPNDFLRHAEDVEHLMCYFGIGDTFTPCHKDLCASSGQNIMCYTESGGSSFWFMTASSDAQRAASYMQNKLGWELDWESRLLTVEELAAAPFDVYILEQKLGDFVLVPPRSCHQVVNKGGLTIKMSWSRMTLTGLELALRCELPLYRRVCRPERYRVKSTIYKALIHQCKELEEALESWPVNKNLSDDSMSTTRGTRAPNPGAMAGIANTLLDLYDEILLTECPRDQNSFDSFSVSSRAQDTQGSDVIGRFSYQSAWEGSDHLDDPYAYACDFCGADIFQSCFECTECTSGEDVEADRLIICSGCYVEGRTCRCQSMSPVHLHSFEKLWHTRQQVVKLLLHGSEAGAWPRGRYRTATDVGAFISSFLDRGDVPTFAAACILHEIRGDARRKSFEDGKVQRRGCIMATEAGRKSHRVPAVDSINCKLCHNARCFAHLLQNCVHSSQAIWLSQTDAGHQALHDLHKQRTSDHSCFLKELEAEEESSGSCSLIVNRFILYARRYRRVQAQKQELTIPGWYDQTDTHMGLDELYITMEDAVDASDTSRIVTAGSTAISSPLTEFDDDATEQLPSPDLHLNIEHPNRQAYTNDEYCVGRSTNISLPRSKQVYVSMPGASVLAQGRGAPSTSPLKTGSYPSLPRRKRTAPTSLVSADSQHTRIALQAEGHSQYGGSTSVSRLASQRRAGAGIPSENGEKRKGPPGISTAELDARTSKDQICRSGVFEASEPISRPAKRRKDDHPSNSLPQSRSDPDAALRELKEDNRALKANVAKVQTELEMLKVKCAVLDTIDAKFAAMERDSRRRGKMQERLQQKIGELQASLEDERQHRQLDQRESEANIHSLRTDLDATKEMVVALHDNSQAIKDDRDRLKTHNDRLLEANLGLLETVRSSGSGQGPNTTACELLKLFETLRDQILPLFVPPRAPLGEASDLEIHGRVYGPASPGGEGEPPRLPSEVTQARTDTSAIIEGNNLKVAPSVESHKSGERPVSPFEAHVNRGSRPTPACDTSHLVRAHIQTGHEHAASTHQLAGPSRRVTVGEYENCDLGPANPSRQSAEVPKLDDPLTVTSRAVAQGHESPGIWPPGDNMSVEPSAYTGARHTGTMRTGEHVPRYQERQLAGPVVNAGPSSGQRPYALQSTYQAGYHRNAVAGYRQSPYYPHHGDNHARVNHSDHHYSRGYPDIRYGRYQHNRGAYRGRTQPRGAHTSEPFQYSGETSRDEW